MGLGLREIIIILLVGGIIFLPWIRKISAPSKAEKLKRPRSSKTDDDEIIDAEWEELDE